MNVLLGFCFVLFGVVGYRLMSRLDRFLGSNKAHACKK